MGLIRKYYFILFALTVVSIYFIYLLCNGDESFSQQTKNCGRFPEEKDIFVDNVMWQVLETPVGFFYLLNAFLDTRWNKTIVRVLLNSKVKRNGVKLFCQFWYDDDKSNPVVVESKGTAISFGK